MLRAAGQGAQAGPPVTLLVYREPGQPEHDQVVRSKAIRARIGRAWPRTLSGATVAAMPLCGSGQIRGYVLAGLMGAAGIHLRC